MLTGAQKESRRVACRKWRANNKDKQAAACKRWREANREYVLTKVKEWRVNNPERARQKDREWYQENKEYKKTKRRERYHSNPENERALSRQWRELNPDKQYAASRRWRENNPEKAAAAYRVCDGRKCNAKGSFTKHDLDRIFTQQKGKCGYCRVFLNKYHADHIIPLAKGGTSYPKNIQLLCQTCNHKKHAKDPVDFAQSLGFLL